MRPRLRSNRPTQTESTLGASHQGKQRLVIYLANSTGGKRTSMIENDTQDDSRDTAGSKEDRHNVTTQFDWIAFKKNLLSKKLPKSSSSRRRKRRANRRGKMKIEPTDLFFLSVPA